MALTPINTLIMRTLLLAISLLTTVILSSQELPPAPHAGAFQEAQQVRHTFSGVFSGDVNLGDKLILYVPNLRSSIYSKDTISLSADGSFSYTLPYAFPVTSIYMRLGNKFSTKAVSYTHLTLPTTPYV